MFFCFGWLFLIDRTMKIDLLCNKTYISSKKRKPNKKRYYNESLIIISGLYGGYETEERKALRMEWNERNGNS